MARKDVPDVLVWEAANQYHEASLVALAQGRTTVFVDELLMEWTGQPRKVVEAAIERAADRGVVDYGVSARTCWPEKRPV